MSSSIQNYSFSLNGKKSAITLYNGDYLEAPIPNGFLLCVTDPPYGSTENKWDVKLNLTEFWGKLLPIADEKAVYTITCIYPFAFELYGSNQKMWRQELIWKKTQASNFFDCNVKPLRIHENIFVFSQVSRYQSTYNPQMTKGKSYTTIIRKEDKKASSNWGRILTESYNVNKTTRYPTTVLEGFNTRDGRIHPTQKPVGLFEWLVKTYSNEGETVIDPFSGSGTTAVACLNSGRDFFGCEMNNEYFDKACKRIENAINNLTENNGLLIDIDAEAVND